jgi:Flp pilus assembly pilin Flp
VLASVNYSQGVTSAWTNVAKFVPKLFAFIVIVVIGYIVAKIVSKLITTILQKVGFDDLVERGGVKKALEKSKYDAAAILAKLVFYAIMLFVLSTGFGVFGTNPISGYLKAIIAYLPLVFVAIVILVVAAAIAAGAKGLIQNSLGGLSYGKMLANLASIAILAFGFIAALDELKIAANVVNAVMYAVLIAIVGVVIVAVGGGGVKTMSQRWEAIAQKYDEEKPKMQQQIRSAPSLADQASQAKSMAQSKMSSDGPPPPPRPGAHRA